MELGADPNSHGGKLVNGLLARDLGVTTPRLLANALNMEWAITMFAKVTIYHIFPETANSVLRIKQLYDVM